MIQMYYDDHNPPHLHAIYGEYKAVISIHDFGILEWARMHKNELIEEWDRARKRQSLFQIDPLE